MLPVFSALSGRVSFTRDHWMSRGLEEKTNNLKTKMEETLHLHSEVPKDFQRMDPNNEAGESKTLEKCKCNTGKIKVAQKVTKK